MLNQGPRGLLPGEIPVILNICADREPMARCPANSYAASLSYCAPLEAHGPEHHFLALTAVLVW